MLSPSPSAVAPLRLTRRFAVVVAVMVFAALLSTHAGDVDAHGSVSNPPSRTYVCRFLQPTSPACAQAWSANSQALYDWMEVNIGDAAGEHQVRIPGGTLCAAGRAKTAAFNDARDDWPTTQLTPGADGLHEISFEATAPHATEYFRFYITNSDYDVETPLAWDDLELVHDSGPLPALTSLSFTMALPERVDSAILYQIWQRSDSPEAFYSCSDVTVAGASGPAPTPTSPPATRKSPCPPLRPSPRSGVAHTCCKGPTWSSMVLPGIAH